MSKAEIVEKCAKHSYQAIDESRKEKIRMFTILLDDVRENLDVISDKQNEYFRDEVKEALLDLYEFLFDLMSEEEQKEKVKDLLNDLLQTQTLHSLLNDKSNEKDLALVFQIEDKIQCAIDFVEDK